MNVDDERRAVRRPRRTGAWIRDIESDACTHARRCRSGHQRAHHRAAKHARKQRLKLIHTHTHAAGTRRRRSLCLVRQRACPQYIYVHIYVYTYIYLDARAGASVRTEIAAHVGLVLCSCCKLNCSAGASRSCVAQPSV